MSQKQNVKNDGTAIASQRDTNIVVHTGVSPEQMTDIMIQVSRAVEVFGQTAIQTMQDRFQTLQEDVLTKFSDTTKTNASAFQDPDFQDALRKAHISFARSGDTDTKDILVDLLAAKSLETARTRKSLAINAAIETTSSLTPEDITALTLAFLARRVMEHSLNSVPAFVAYFNSRIAPLVDKVPREASCYEHLVSTGCASISVGSADVLEIYRESYAGLFNKGFTSEEFAAAQPNEAIRSLAGLTQQCLNNPKKLQIAFLNKDGFSEFAKANNIPQDVQAALWNFNQSTMFTKVELIERYQQAMPAMVLLDEVWRGTKLQNLELTTTGLAIGHANAQRLFGFSADLSIWIK